MWSINKHCMREGIFDLVDKATNSEWQEHYSSVSVCESKYEE